MPKKKPESFEENFNELQKLAEELQGDQISIDELVPRMKEAVKSIEICRSVLSSTKTQLEEIKEAFDEEDQV